MQIRVVYVEGCPGWQAVATRVRTALVAIGQPDTLVELVPVQTAAQAAAEKFAGSPTVLVDGVDLFPGTPPRRDLAGRVFWGPSGLTGVPTRIALIDALSQLTAPAGRLHQRGEHRL